MTIRAVPCPKCRRVPQAAKLENGDYAISCQSAGCKMNLYCLGKTEDEARSCWNGCMDRKDY